MTQRIRAIGALCSATALGEDRLVGGAGKDRLVGGPQEDSLIQ